MGESMVTESSFLGRGIRFPLAVDHTGAVGLTAGVAAIETGIRMILSTAPGERAMRPDFGCAIWDLLFEPINSNTLGLMSEAVREALSRWEPRIDVDDIDVDPDESALGAVRILVSYTVRATNDRRNLVFPFYVIPGEGDEPTNPAMSPTNTPMSPTNTPMSPTNTPMSKD